jgi:4-amino-4-deoxy-L-arabinose transferase-like glycosyltransferase
MIFPQISRGISSLRRSLVRRPFEVWALGLVFIGAIILRFYRLDSFPPGVQHDEVFVSNFAQTILAGQYPIFFDLNRGNEPLFMYLVAVAFRLFGTNVWALRGTAALCGSAALFVTYLLAREWFPSNPNHAAPATAPERSQSVIALLTAAGLASSFWLLFESRVGLHAISTLLLASLTFYSFWRGWTRDRRVWLVASGVLAGLSAYTYRSGIFVPLALGVFVLYTFIFHRRLWKNNVLFAPLIFLIAGLVYAPLGYYILSHPETSLARIGDLSGDIYSLLGGNPLPILHNAVAVAAMFGVKGDAEWRYNVAFRPVFDPVWGIMFYAGVLLALWRARRAPYAFALVWLGVMILPSVLSADNPSQHRSVGAIGAAYMFPAIALGSAGEWSRTHWKNNGKWLFGFVAGLLVLLAAVEGVRYYFVVWPENAQVRSIYRADLSEAAHWLDANDSAVRVMISAAFANDLDRGAFDLESGRSHDLHFFAGANTFVIPDAASALYVSPSTGPIAADLRQAFIGKGAPIYEVIGGSGQDELAVYYASAAALQAWRRSVPKQVVATSPDGQLSVLGAELPESMQSGQKLRAVIWWQVQRPLFADADSLSWTASLADSNNYVWSESAGLGYTPSQWQPGDIIASAFDLEVPPDALPGDYRLRLQLSVRGHTYVFRGSDGLDETETTLGEVQVTRGAVPLAKPDLPVRYPLKAKFGEAVQLMGSDAIGNVAAGETWRLILFWKANSPIQEDYRIRLRAVSADGKLIAKSDDAVLAPTYPTRLWRTGEYLRTIQDLNIPSDAPNGKVVVRLFLLDPAGNPVGRTDGVPVAGIEIGGRTHSSTRPIPAHSVNASFGNDISMIGYNLTSESVTAGRPISVTLYWQALGPTDRAYTVFVHLLNKDGRVVGQLDSAPMQGKAPTDTWQAGEFFSDLYEFSVVRDAPPGAAELEIGFYDPATGIRLPATDASGNSIGDHILIEGLTIRQ